VRIERISASKRIDAPFVVRASRRLAKRDDSARRSAILDNIS